MHFSTSLLLSLSTLLVAAVAQTNTTSHGVYCLQFPPAAIPRGGNATLAPEAITDLSEALANNSFTPALPTDGIKLSPGQSSKVGFEGNGGFQVCLQNFYFFKTVTVPLKTISEAVAEMKDTCCSAQPQSPQILIGRRGYCQDSKAFVKSTDGSEVKVVAQDYGENCCGMWGC